jgi:hypothetical protein
MPTPKEQLTKASPSIKVADHVLHLHMPEYPAANMPGGEALVTAIRALTSSISQTLAEHQAISAKAQAMLADVAKQQNALAGSIEKLLAKSTAAAGGKAKSYEVELPGDDGETRTVRIVPRN